MNNSKSKIQNARNAASPGHSQFAVFADLHLHSRFSDGTFAPEEIVARGQRAGFAALALTDHDTVEGCVRMGTACRAAGIEFISGVELTAEHGDHELHILGYSLDVTNKKLLAQLAGFQIVRQNRIREMVARLNELRVPLEAEDVFALANCSSPGRPHVARSLVRGGHCESLDQAFEYYLKKGRPAWVAKARMSALEAIELVHQAGGLAVLAHPGLNHADDLIPDLATAGLDGLECLHTKHSHLATRHYLEMAEQLKLLVTGGSDCHGQSKGKTLIGTVRLPYEHVEKLKAAVSRKTVEPLHR